MKKSVFVFLSALLLAFSISGCSDNNEQASGGSTTEASSVTESKPDNSSASDSENSSDNKQNSDTSEESDSGSESSDSSGSADIGASTEIPEISPQRNEITDTAKSLVGIPYTFSEASPEKGFDNSGFIYYVLRENGYINCPRGTEEQLTMGTRIGYDEVLPGDVVFFSDKDEETGEENYFGGIYVGDGQLIYSPYPGEKVKYGDFTNSYWKESFKFGIKIA